ncbi:MAG TPA: tryptophan synthase subunit beta [Armatimonadota bacterium]|nr:tryptophan synthase subunit beta [Armatimonadota bacterium]
MATHDDAQQVAGRFGRFGGQYVPATLVNALEELEVALEGAMADPSFRDDLDSLLRDYVGRPSPLYYARRLSHEVGAKVYLKREDLNHTGAHKINNTMGQGLLARRMGKQKLIAETGAGQHGVATATAAALLGMPCQVYMGTEDIRRQRLNVYRMKLLGTEVLPVTTGSATLKDAVEEALRAWMGSYEDTFYVLGSVCGPHPYPTMVRDFQRIVGEEVREQCLQKEGRLPTRLVACVGGGSNSIGLFYDFIREEGVELIGVEAAGHGLETGEHAATLTCGTFGVIDGAATKVIQDEDGQIKPVHSVAAGLDYPGVGPEHAMLQETGRARYESVTDDEALAAFRTLARVEGIIPALESAHAVAQVLKMADEFTPEDIVVINVSGRGDKDCEEVARLTGEE